MIDAGEIYESLKGRLTTTLRKSLGVTGIKTLKVNRVWADDNLDPQDFQGQLDAKLNMRSWAIPVYADISLVDPASGKEIDRAKKIRLMEIPKITPRQSFIVGGEEFQVANQLRLKSGVYVKSVPSETSAHFKFPIGYSKRNFSMDYDPAEKKWTAFLDGKTVPLYSYLNALGLTDEEISEKLGQEHLDKMKADADLRKDLAKIRTVVTGEKGLPGEPATNANRIREVLYALPMGPDVPRLKYGKEYKKFDKGLVLDALGNLQGVLSGEEEPDIDNSRFKEFRTFDDILVERIEKTTPLLQGRIKQRMREKTAIRDIIQPDKLSDVVTSFFNRSQLSNYPTQSNPINFLSGHTRTTVFGEGSIGNKRAVTNVERGVDPSMMGTIDPLHSPEGGDIGAVMHITVGAKKGDGVILRTFWDPKTQKHVTLGHPDVYNKRIAFPNEYKREPSGRFVPVDPSIRVMHRGKVLTVSPAEVDLIVERPQDLFDFSTNLVPFVNAMHGGRGLMASKMYDQAVSVINPEPPLVRSASTPKKALDETFERIVGGLAATKSPVDGTVDEVADRQITVRDGAGKSHKVNLYKDFPLNSRSFITSKSKVGVGDKVKKGDVLADSNFTKDGDLAIGKNLLMGWVPYRGWSYEDSIVMSESAAKKMTSEHLYKVDHRDSPEGLSGRDRYAAYFPNRFTAEQLAKLDDDGVVKIGTTVRSGDPLVVYLAKKNITPEDVVLGKISRNLVRPYSDASQTWEEPFNGVVTHVQRTAGGRAKVLVKTEEPLQTGDKVVSRYAAKGLVSRVVPDEEMPRTKDGRTLELLLNPIGLPSRMNPAQIYEALAGKIAVKTGKPYVVDNFEPGDLRERIRGDLKKAGLSETEEVIDPVSGRSLGQVTVGNQFLMKLEHAAKEKFNAREPSGAYTADLRPAKSGEGAQAIGHMEQSALLSHGALYNLRDFTNYKAGKNDEFWRALQMNEPLPPPTSTFAFDKFVALLKGAGINVERRGTQFQLKPLTDDQTEGMSAGAISSSRMLLGKNLKPEKGGLFDEEVTGGLTGQRWAHVDLPYEVPNPVFEPAIRGVMGLTQREYDDIIEERVSVDAFAKPTPKEQGGLTGPAALRRMLGQIDIPKAIQELKRQARIAKGSDLNHFNRAIRFLSNLRTNQISTDDLFIKKVPVLPPIYRPVYPLPDGTLNVSDVNYLYRDLVAIKNQLADLSKVLPEEHLREQRADLYQAVKAIAGTGDPVSSEHYRGILDIVTGEYPKGSYFQSRVIRKQQELSGRAAISGDPTLGMDEVGIPEDMAWVIFKPFAVRKMVERGMAPLEAERHIADRTMIAKDALGRAMAERPVIVNRAPTLHKHGIIALKPTLVPDKSVHLNQMVTVGLGADFDGDSNFCELFIHQNSGASRVHIAGFPHIAESGIQKGKNIEYDVPPGVLIPAFDGRTIRLMPVTKWSIHPDCGKWIVKTRRRRELIVSQDHSLYTFNPDTLECEKSRPTDSVGRCAPIFNGDRSIDEKPVVSSIEIVGDLLWRPSRRVESKTPLDAGFGWLLGAFIGDGWTSERSNLYQVILAGAREDHPVIQRWASELARITDYPIGTSSHPHTFEGKGCASAKAVNSCHGFAAWLRETCGHLAENKRLPGFVLGAPLAFRRGLFCGLMDTDGCACWSRGTTTKKSQFSLSFTTISHDLALGVRGLAMSLGIQSGLSSYRRRDKANHIVTFSSPQVKKALPWLRLESPQKQAALDRLAATDIGPNRDDKVPFPPSVRESVTRLLGRHTTATKKFRRVTERDKGAQSLYSEVRRSSCGYITRFQARAILAALPVEACLELPERWVDWVQDESIAWDLIVSAEDTGEKMVMYDITVPGAWTFCTADGLVVQDTVGIHVPVTDEAVREAQEMMPSTMPLSTSEKVLTVPRHESLVGLYRLTSAGKKTSKTYVSEIEAVMAFHKGEISETDVVQVGGVETTVGRVLVNKTLPEKLRRPDLVIDSKKASEIVGAIARENPRALAPVVDTLKDVGNEYAFLSGLSVGIDDLHIPKARVDEVMSKYDSQAAEATRTTKNRKELDRKVVQIYSKAYDDLKVLTSKDFADRNTSLGQMVTSGGRGNIDQAAQMLTAPVLVEDVRGKIHPYPIRTGYAHGMTPPDFWVANYGSRKGAVETKLSTAEPGALTKSMVQTSIENRIAPGAPPAEERGLEFSVDDRESIGRYVMAEYPGLARRGDLFDAQLRNRLKAAGKKTVELGSPLMSTHPQGTYLWSYGLDERGRQPRPGAFIGVTAAQAIGEPMTQLILGSKHVQGLAGQARTAGSGEAAVATMTGFQKLKTLLEMPEKVDQKALVAREGGIVESVQKAPGGWDVRLDGKTHFTAFEPTVKAGARVNPGDRLSQGLVDPRDLLETKGIDHTRKYLVDEIFGIFGGKVRKKHIETVVRSVTDTALVTDSGQRTDFVEGDIVPINVVRAENRKGAVPVSLDLARNAMLMEEVDRLGGAEKILTDEDIATLKEMGRDQVIANPNPVKFRPILKGVELTPMARKDWIAGLSYRRLKDVITKGVAEGWKSDLKGWNPIPGLAYGAAIEEPKKTSA